MREKRTFTVCAIIITLIMMLCLVGVGNVVADGPAGPHTIAGRVYKSDGKTPGEGSEGAYAAVIIEHDGEKSTYVDHDGLQMNETTGTYWYAVTIPEGAWDVGDRFWLWIDGSGWGDENFTCVDHDDTGVNSWEVKLAQMPVDVDTGDYNFKPLIAFLFAIILAVVGIIIGLLRPLRLPFTGRPKQPTDLVEGMMITGAAVIPEELPPDDAPAPAAAAPAAAAPAADAADTTAAPGEDQHNCPTCGGKMDFIEEYNNYYCYTCQKYPDEDEPASDEDLPPPDEEDLPPPDDATPPEGGA
jgi:hypothetical protein